VQILIKTYCISVYSSCSVSGASEIGGEWVFKDIYIYMYICGMTTKVIESHFKILSKEVSNFCSVDIWKSNMLDHPYEANYRK
jgi:hypothetical protein